MKSSSLVKVSLGCATFCLAAGLLYGWFFRVGCNESTVLNMSWGVVILAYACFAWGLIRKQANMVKLGVAIFGCYLAMVTCLILAALKSLR